MNERTFVILDVETTGLSPSNGDRVIEIACQKIRDKQSIGSFETLINPERSISLEAYMVNRISQEMLAAAPKAEEVLDEFLKFVGGAPVIGHNIRFDLKFINNELALADKPMLVDNFAIDTVKMARGLMPGNGRYSLSVIAQTLGIKEDQKHRAMSDVIMTRDVFFQLLKVGEEKGIRSFNDIFDLYGVVNINRQKKKYKKQLILEAIEMEIPLNLLYSGMQSGSTARRVTPKRLMGTGKDVTLVGYCHLREAERNFNVDKIVRLEPLTQAVN